MAWQAGRLHGMRERRKKEVWDRDGMLRRQPNFRAGALLQHA